VNAGDEDKRRDRGREYVDKAQGRMIGHQVSAAFAAILALAERGFLECSHVLGA
jgi:hypothetical protein